MTSLYSKYVVAAILLICLALQSSAIPRPQEPWEASLMPTYVDECKTKEDIETLCQTCAKKTKSTIVYPMCCEGREEARTWCEKYIGFGRQKDPEW